MEVVARLFGNRVGCKSLLMAQSSQGKQWHRSWDACVMKEDPVGSPLRSQAGTQVSWSVLRDEADPLSLPKAGAADGLGAACPASRMRLCVHRWNYVKMKMKL